ETTDETEAAAEPEVSAEEPETSNSSMIEDESMESSTEEFSFDSDDGTDKDVFEKLTDEDYSPEEDETVSDMDEEFVLPQETEEEPASTVDSASEDTGAEKEENAFVIGGDDDMDEDSFLDLDEDETPKEDDLISNMTGAEDTTPTEVVLEGIEMDAQEQITAVTRAELLLAQGKEKEAIELFEDISNQKGVTPWVSKRLGHLNIGEQTSSNTAEIETETETEESE
ncbi:hypothetical protein ACFL50_02495, partial [Candidatus Latescibacterota bacterium]